MHTDEENEGMLCFSKKKKKPQTSYRLRWKMSLLTYIYEILMIKHYLGLYYNVYIVKLTDCHWIICSAAFVVSTAVLMLISLCYTGPVNEVLIVFVGWTSQNYCNLLNNVSETYWKGNRVNQLTNLVTWHFCSSVNCMTTLHVSSYPCLSWIHSNYLVLRPAACYKVF